jgi:hypothetical protein
MSGLGSAPAPILNLTFHVSARERKIALTQKTHQKKMMFVPKCRRVVGILMVVSLAFAQDYADYQDYGDYAEDNLYHDYAQHQQEKGIGG